MNLEQANIFTGEGPRQENCSQGREDRGGPFREGFIVTGRRHSIKTFTRTLVETLQENSDILPGGSRRYLTTILTR